MDTVDRWLASNGAYWRLFVLAGVGVLLGGEGEHRPLWSGFANLVWWAVVPLILRSGTLGAGRRWGIRFRLPTVRRVVRSFVFANRWPVAVAYGVLGAWFAQWHYDVAWFSVLHGTVSGVATAYAARPLQEQEAPVS